MPSRAREKSSEIKAARLIFHARLLVLQIASDAWWGAGKAGLPFMPLSTLFRLTVVRVVFSAES